MLMVTPGERIKELRQESNISQQKLSDILGYKTYTTVSKWEADASLPPGRELRKLAEYFEVSTDYLLGVEDFSTRYLVDQAEEGVELDFFESINEGYLHTNEQRQKIPVPPYILEEPADHYFVVKVHTDSMNRMISNGDNVVMLDYSKVENPIYKTGDILGVKINDEYRLQYLRKTDSRYYLEPASFIEGFDTTTYTCEEFYQIEVIGKVIYAFRSFN